MTVVLAAVVGFVVMEPLAYAGHRWVMHGAGWVWHCSHHARTRTRFEANDGFPVAFAALTIMAMAAATLVPAVHLLLAVGVGVTAYGAAYVFVHDVYIHERLGRLPRARFLEWLRRAHGLHHRHGGEPYGMLCPILPRRLRAELATSSRDSGPGWRSGRAGWRSPAAP